jgi:hypothetical protein
MAVLGRPKKIQIDADQPAWVCHKCGVKYGSFRAGLATWHQDTCGCCGTVTSCTEPRDYGYLLLGWKSRRDDEDKKEQDGRDVDEDGVG